MTIFALALVLIGTSFVLLTRFSVQNDLWAFLPTVGDSAEKRLTRDLLTGRLSRSLVLAVVPGACVERNDCTEQQKAEARRIADRLKNTLANDEAVASASSGPVPGFEKAVYDLYFPSRFALARPGPGAPYSKENITARVKGLRDFLAGPQAAMYRSHLVEDPLLYFPEQIEQLAALKPQGVEVEEGQFVTHGGIGLVFAELLPERNGEEKARLLSSLKNAFAREKGSSSEARLLLSGALPFEVAGEAMSKADMQRVGFVSIGMAILLSLFLFRSVLSLLAVLFPVAFGFAFGCSATLLIFKEVHVLTLAFGASLIGVSLDYPLHVLNEGALKQCSLAQAARHARPGLLIGCLTTVVGFFSFGLTSASALLQVAVFSVTGLIAALAATLYVVPILPFRYGDGSVQRRINLQLEMVLPHVSRHAYTYMALVTLALISSAAFVFTQNYRTDPRVLDPSPRELKDDDQYVRNQLGLTEDMLVATGPDLKDAIDQSYALATDLQKRAAEGKIEGYRSLSALYLPEKIQKENRALAASQVTRTRLVEALEQSEFDPEAFAATPLGTEAARDLPLLSFDQIESSVLGHMADAFALKNEKGASVVTQVSASEAQLRDLVEKHPRLLHYRPEKFLAQSFLALALNIRSALLIALVLMLAIVAVRNRSLRRTMSAFLPAAVAALGSLAIVGQIESLHVFHLLSSVVVLSMGIDYGTFMVEAHRREGRADAWPSVVAAAFSTLVSFGCLAFSAVPALRAIGMVIGLGITIALLATPLCYSILPSPEKNGAH